MKKAKKKKQKTVVKKRKAKKVRRPGPPPAGLEAPEATLVDIPEMIEMKCPMCLAHWANAHIKFGQKIEKEHFAVRDDLKEQVTFQKNGLPTCPVCAFEYTPNSIYGLMMTASTRANMERKLWKPASGMKIQSPILPDDMKDMPS